MASLQDHPFLNFVIALLLLSFAVWLGGRLSRRWSIAEDIRSDYGVVLTATLTLLGLIIGFSFSMAGSRYDIRKTYEEAEANAIGTEYLRADLLPEADAARVKELLRRYTDLRIRFYSLHEGEELHKVNAETAKLQQQLWEAVSRTANDQPTPLRALVVSGMNDVLNSEGYTQAAWWNRIPVGAWFLMFGIALFGNFLLGYGERRVDTKLLVVLPLVVAISFLLIADIDSPRSGVIMVHPQNLMRLQAGFGVE